MTSPRRRYRRRDDDDLAASRLRRRNRHPRLLSIGSHHISSGFGWVVGIEAAEAVFIAAGSFLLPRIAAPGENLPLENVALVDPHPGAERERQVPECADLPLIFQVAGQQLSVRATRAIVSRIEEHFGGRLPSPAELLAADPHVLRASGLSARKGETLRALAERFVDGRLSDEALSQMTDDKVEAVLTEVPGIGPWTAHGFLLVALDRPDVFLSGDLAVRRAI